MRAVFFIASNTLRQVVRQKLFLNVILFGLAMMVLAGVVSNLTFSHQARVIRSIGLSGVSMALDLMAVLVSVSLVHGEIERRTLFVILTRPLSRYQYVAGRYVGLLAVLALLLVGLSALFLLVLSSIGGQVTRQDLVALAAALPEAAVLGAVGVAFSTFSTPTLSTGLSLGVWMISASTDDLVALTSADSPVLPFMRGLSYVFPSLARFNLREAAVYNFPVPISDVAFTFAYGALFAAAIVTVAGVILSRREMV